METLLFGIDIGSMGIGVQGVANIGVLPRLDSCRGPSHAS